MPSKKRKKKEAVSSSVPVINRQVIALCIVLLACALLRVAYLVQYKANVPYYSGLIVDSQYYDDWAQRIARGIGYGSKPFYLAPLYPYFLALIYMGVGRNFAVVYAFQAVLGVLNLALVYLIGRRLFGHISGLLAIIILTLYAPLMFFEAKILSETLAITLSLASVLILLKAVDKPAAWKYLVVGFALGLTAVCRPMALLTAILTLGWLWWSRVEKRQSAAAWVLIGLMVPLLFVAGRNQFIGKDFALISTNVGVTFAQGNNAQADGVCMVVLPGFTGSIMDQQAEEIAIASRRLGRQLKPSEASAYWLKQGLKFIWEKPLLFAKLTGRRLIWSLHNQESPCSYNLYLEKQLVPFLRWLPVPFALIFGLAIFGFLRSLAEKAKKEAMLVSLYVLSTFIVLLAFFVTSRYRLPAVPFLGIFAGYGLAEMVNYWRERSVTVFAIALCCLVGAFLPSLVPYPIPHVTPEAPVDLGVSYLINGQIDKAIQQFREALKMKPGFAVAHKNLGEAFLRQGRLREAEAEYKKAISINPSDWSAYFGLGMALARQQKFAEAIPSFAKSLRLNPFNAEAHNNLAVALFVTGDYSGAWREVRLCHENGGTCDPSFIRALTSMMPEPE